MDAGELRKAQDQVKQQRRCKSVIGKLNKVYHQPPKVRPSSSFPHPYTGLRDNEIQAILGRFKQSLGNFREKISKTLK